MSIDYLKWGTIGKYFTCDREKLKKASYDCYYLFEYINACYNTYKEKQNNFPKTTKIISSKRKEHIKKYIINKGI